MVAPKPTQTLMILGLLVMTEAAMEILDSCSSEHVTDAIIGIEDCKPRPVIVTLPWPNNTNVQQVRDSFS